MSGPTGGKDTAVWRFITANKGTINAANAFVSKYTWRDPPGSVLRRVKRQAAALNTKAQRAAQQALAARRGNIEETAQEILLRKMSDLWRGPNNVDGSASRFDPALQTEAIANKTLRLYHSNPEKGGPETLLNALSDGDISAFVHATPAQLSMLQPLLRFYIVNNQGDQEEVYFSDHVNLDQILRFARDRRSNNTSNTRKMKGSEVGIKSFTWDYNNKHEGDKIISANLELYFGSMSELVNEHYLNFLFTNGRSSRGKLPPLGSGPSSATQRRIVALEAIIEEKGKYLLPASGKIPTGKPRSDKKEFRQLKVAVGWSVPNGNRADLQRLFDTPAKLKSFIAGVKATQKIILLSLVNYDVNFTQEGPVTLKLSYVGSSDHHLSSIESDILAAGDNDSHKDAQVYISLKGLTKGEDGTEVQTNVYPSGYLHHQLTNYSLNVSTGEEWFGLSATSKAKVPVNLRRLENEAEFLSAKIELLTFQKEASHGKSKSANVEALKVQLATLDEAHTRAKKAMQEKRYSRLMDNLLGAGGSKSSKVFVAYAKELPGGQIGITFYGKKESGKIASETRDRLAKERAEESSTDKKEKTTERKLGTFTRSVKGGASDAVPGEAMAIPFVRFGDVVLAAMENSGMPEDIGFIFGTFLPGSLGIEGFSTGNSSQGGIGRRHGSIYDIPITLEYLSQFLFDNVVARDLDEYPFRSFFDSLLTALTRLMNSLTGYKLRVSFDYTLYMTYEKIYGKDPNPSSIYASDLKKAAKNLKNTIYSTSKPIKSYYLLYAKQMSTPSGGNRAIDEKNGIYHYVLGADRGIAKNFNFSKDDTPFFQAMNIEGMTATSNYQALIQPQQISLEMVGNTIHRNGDMIYIDSRAALGTMANEILTLGGYYRVVRSSNKISNRGYTTTIDAKLEHRTHSNG